MESQFELEWNILSGFTSLQIIHEIQYNLQKRNIELEKLTDRIIFMSMFNVTDWTKKRKRRNLCFEF